MKSSLLSEFSKNDKTAWKKKVEKELKGRAYGELLFQPATSVFIEPYYVETELPAREIRQEIQGCQRSVPGWLTVPAITFDSPLVVNQEVRTQLEGGADGVWLRCGDKSLVHLELAKALHTIRPTDTPIFLDSSESPVGIVNELSQGSGYYLKGGIVYDPLAAWMQTGTSPQKAFDEIVSGMGATKMMREFRSYAVESHLFHEAGANVVQELAYTLSSFVTYLDQLTERGISPLLAANRMLFSMSIGPEFLTEIAKLRAVRYLYRHITRAYGLPDDLCQATIHCRNSRLFRSFRSPHTNQIRASAEAMSAVMGGCDVLTLEPYDASFAEPTEFSERMARNVSLIMKNESYLDKVADPAAGSYSLEVLTQKIADAAWEKFLDLEKQGGLMQAFEKNIIQEAISKTWMSRVEAYQSGKVLVGINKFREEGQGSPIPIDVPNQDLTPQWEYDLLAARSLDDIF